MNAGRRQFVHGVPRPFLQRTLVRVGMAVVLAACVVLAQWSYWARLKPVSQMFHNQTLFMSRLSEEVQQLQWRWDALDASKTEEQFEQARRMLFAGEQDQAGWQTQVVTQTLALAIEARPTLGVGESRRLGSNSYTIHPATVVFEPLPAPRQSNAPYNRLLLSLREIESIAKRVDLVELSATGRSNSLEQARAVFHLWSPERSAP